MKITVMVIAGIAAIAGVIWYLFMRKPEPTPPPKEAAVEAIGTGSPVALEPVPSVSLINHSVVGEVVIPKPAPYIGEPVVPPAAIKAMVETAIINAVAVTPITTGHGGVQAASTVMNMNLTGVNPDGTCRQNASNPLDYYSMNPFGICQYHYDWPYCMDYDDRKIYPKAEFYKRFPGKECGS